MPERCVALRGLPTCATTSCATAHRHQRGFSLLELLVALIVVVLVTTLVNISVNSGGEDVRLQALMHEFAEVGSYALDEAQTTGMDYGLLIDEEQQDGQTIYTFNWLEHPIEGWRETLTGKEIFTKEHLPAGVTVDFELEDSPLTDKKAEDKAKYRVGKQGEDPTEEKDEIHPQVVFYSSGETTVGALNVRKAKGGDLLWRVEWDLLGRFKVLRRGEPEDIDEKDEKR